ncbi:MAG: succinylglutamate desuccinylase/aspartoacylase family protein, partial [Candidatus Polarisedimenticolia bacterium]
SEPLVVGTVSVLPGQAASGWLEVPAGRDPKTDPAVRIPVSVARGVRPGPVLALVAGTHGYEYTSILALQRLRPRLRPEAMSGAVILVHMANPPAFHGRRIYTNADGRNLNRVYPGDPEGTETERIAAALSRAVIDRATHLIDMHCGDGNESLRPYSYWTVTGDRGLDETGREMALAYGLDHIVIDRERPKDPKKSMYTATTAILRGKPAITTESGGAGLTDDASVAAHEAGALGVIGRLGIMETPSVRVTRPVWVVRSEVVRAPAAGVWTPAVAKEQTVAGGALLGRITDPFGTLLHEVRAPFAGEMLYVVATPPVAAGEPLAMVGETSETLPAGLEAAGGRPE